VHAKPWGGLLADPCVHLVKGSTLKGGGPGEGGQQRQIFGREVAGGNGGDRPPEDRNLDLAELRRGLQPVGADRGENER